MYQLTPRMLQRFQSDLRKYHDLFSGGRCLGWEQEELLVNAIKSDTQVHHHVVWREKGHDDQADLRIKTNGTVHLVQVKSGEIRREASLILSGHRLGRFNGNLKDITAYLNGMVSNILAVPYRKVDGERGREHIYRVCYVEIRYLTGLTPHGWNGLVQTNEYGVVSKIHPSMSWQIWWTIPLTLIKATHSFTIR